MTPRGKRMLACEEGLLLSVYRCQAGEPTIGYGHKLTSREILSGVFADGISKEQAEQLLEHDIRIAESTIAEVVKVPLNANQHDALVCLVFNTGGGVLKGGAPKLTSALQRGDWATAAHEMLDICHVRNPKTKRKEPNPGLCARRAREAKLFLTPMEPHND